MQRLHFGFQTFPFQSSIMSITAMFRVAIVVAAVLGVASDVAEDGRYFRRVTIEIKNLCTSHRLVNPRTYIKRGLQTWQFESVIPIGGKDTVKYEKIGHTATGITAVFTLDLDPINAGSYARRVAFMFSIPYDFGLWSTYYAAGFFGTFKDCDYELYRQMYYDNQDGFQRRTVDYPINYSSGRFTVKQLRTHGQREGYYNFVLEISDN